MGSNDGLPGFVAHGAFGIGSRTPGLPQNSPPLYDGSFKLELSRTIDFAVRRGSLPSSLPNNDRCARAEALELVAVPIFDFTLDRFAPFASAGMLDSDADFGRRAPAVDCAVAARVPDTGDVGGWWWECCGPAVRARRTASTPPPAATPTGAVVPKPFVADMSTSLSPRRDLLRWAQYRSDPSSSCAAVSDPIMSVNTQDSTHIWLGLPPRGAGVAEGTDGNRPSLIVDCAAFWGCSPGSARLHCLPACQTLLEGSQPTAARRAFSRVAFPVDGPLSTGLYVTPALSNSRISPGRNDFAVKIKHVSSKRETGQVQVF